MNTVKKSWVSPKATLEEFTPNEYVFSSCWGVGCTVRGSDKIPQYEGNYWNRHESNTHSADACGKSTNQYLYDSNDDGVVDSMYEMSSDQGRMECTLYTDDNYTTVLTDFSTINSGSNVYWITKNTSDGRVWHHKGIAGSLYPNHPNRS